MKPFFTRSLAVLGTVAVSLTPVFARETSRSAPLSAMASAKDWTTASTIYDFTVKDLDDKDVSLEKYRGHPVVVVNVATYCGLTKTNYKQLNELYAKYKDQGLKIAAFPCNQFGNQEPGCSVDIQEFLKKNNVEFDVYGKIDVNGDTAHPLYKWLKSKQGGTMGDAIKWNFSKFLVDKQGVPINRYAPTTEPVSIEKDIKKIL